MAAEKDSDLIHTATICSFVSVIQGIIGPIVWKSLGIIQSILTLPNSLTSALTLRQLFILESPVSVTIFLVSWGLRGGRPQGCSSWNTHTHTLLSGSQVGFLYWQHISREKEQQNETSYRAGAQETKRRASSASTLHLDIVWSEGLWSAVWFSLLKGLFFLSWTRAIAAFISSHVTKVIMSYVNVLEIKSEDYSIKNQVTAKAWVVHIQKYLFFSCSWYMSNSWLQQKIVTNSITVTHNQAIRVQFITTV